MMPPIELAGTRRRKPHSIHPFVALVVTAVALATLLLHHGYKQLSTALGVAEQGRASLEAQVVEANTLASTLRLQVVALERKVEDAHQRADKLADAMDAMAPRIPGRKRAPTLVEESRR